MPTGRTVKNPHNYYPAQISSLNTLVLLAETLRRTHESRCPRVSGITPRGEVSIYAFIGFMCNVVQQKNLEQFAETSSYIFKNWFYARSNDNTNDVELPITAHLVLGFLLITQLSQYNKITISPQEMKNNFNELTRDLHMPESHFTELYTFWTDLIKQLGFDFRTHYNSHFPAWRHAETSGPTI